jgi:hypothetical protein
MAVMVAFQQVAADECTRAVRKLAVKCVLGRVVELMPIEVLGPRIAFAASGLCTLESFVQSLSAPPSLARRTCRV